LDLCDLALGENFEVRSFWKVLSYQAVGILIQATFPCMIWGCEVEPGGEVFGDLLVIGEFFSVVGGNLHRLTDGKAPPAPPLDAPQALRLTREPLANVERYDDLRDRRQRHAS
jgi:hypothetical protein